MEEDFGQYQRPGSSREDRRTVCRRSMDKCKSSKNGQETQASKDTAKRKEAKFEEAAKLETAIKAWETPHAKA